MRKQYMIFIAPIHGVQLGADELELVGPVLRFKRDNHVVAEFTSYMGWLELEEKREPANNVLSLVPKPDGSAAPSAPEPAP